MVRTRFAPSPTGSLHVGGARTALFNYLFAKSQKGSFILRIEDTDQTRSTESSKLKMMESLTWLGLDWDEGPDKGGDFGPYVQSERLDIYKSVTDKLIGEQKAYRCFCTTGELETNKLESEKKGQNPVYAGKCRSLTEDETSELIKQKKSFTIRFKVDGKEVVVVDDLVQGKVTFDSGMIGDYIIVKSDGFPTYNFAVVVDDFLMKITHVIRGVGHLSNTPRQVLIARALGYPLPIYAHVSQIVGPDRKKISKRHGATSLEEYKKMGYLPEAFLNYLALLGWSVPGGEEFVRKAKLEKIFDIKRAGKSDAIFDHKKLTWLNGKYIREYPLEAIMELVIPFLKAMKNFPSEKADLKNGHFREIISNMRNYFDILSSAGNIILPFFADSQVPGDDATLNWIKDEKGSRAIIALLNKLQAQGPVTKEEFFNLVKESGKEAGAKGKGLFMPIRAALSGTLTGPELPILYDLLGHERVVKRIKENLAFAGISV